MSKAADGEADDVRGVGFDQRAYLGVLRGDLVERRSPAQQREDGGLGERHQDHTRELGDVRKQTRDAGRWGGAKRDHEHRGLDLQHEPAHRERKRSCAFFREQAMPAQLPGVESGIR